jgi:hypothetical protein
MDVIVVAVIIVLVMVTLWWVMKPLWQTADAEHPLGVSTMRQTMEELLHRRDATYAAIKELELDLAGNKVAEADYNHVRSQLTRQAADILRRLDRLAENHDENLEAELDTLLAETLLDEQLKREILREVASLRNGSGKQDQDQAAGFEETVLIDCPECHAPVHLDDAFCSRCGTALVARCPQCANETKPGDVFCSRCGTRLVAEAVE